MVVQISFFGLIQVLEFRSSDRTWIFSLIRKIKLQNSGLIRMLKPWKLSVTWILELTIVTLIRMLKPRTGDETRILDLQSSIYTLFWLAWLNFECEIFP